MIICCDYVRDCSLIDTCSARVTTYTVHSFLRNIALVTSVEGHSTNIQLLAYISLYSTKAIQYYYCEREQYLIIISFSFSYVLLQNLMLLENFLLP